MEHKDKKINNKENEIVKQLNNMTAFGIGGLGILPAAEKELGNKGIKSDKENSRE
ncbi:hypothetical protein [Clostridium sp. OS1-26]|uniref:hypothetical protein n=1 Tax=Clostridium sp. OS1-26 TaxID=3070681 RepID=UPI0027DED551|nr:hypothetical protein [Clostridium sp. OS1-26]WML34136.1 hypothetical protein RCG18_22985 [Clostridium sp. OS1-26]